MDMNIGRAESSNGFMRTIAGIVLVSFTTVTVSPCVHAMQQYSDQQELRRQWVAQERENVGRTLGRAKARLQALIDRTGRGSGPGSASIQSLRADLSSWRQDYRQLTSEVKAELDGTTALLTSRNVPKVILDRQAAMVQTFASQALAVEADIDVILETPDDALAQKKSKDLLDRLNATPLDRSHQSFDSRRLPNDLLKADPQRKPKLTVDAFQAALLTENEAAARYAQATPFDLSQLPGASTPTYLEPTAEVSIDSAIRAKAEELNRDPVAIYNWVRNSIYFQPTWGAIQDASLTLSSRQGNAFDIASLTIALLRASGVPSRYVYGTIELPEAKFRNWTGGFESVLGAIDFSSAGGVPLVAVTAGGRITKVRMEHVWVEAAIDFVPSRGARNRAADTWVSLDTSYKQFEYHTGIDAREAAGVNPTALAQSLISSATINESAGWIDGLNGSLLQRSQLQARATLEAHVGSTLGQSSVGEVLGGRRIVTLTSPTLPSGLANRVLVAGARFAAVPASLQQQISFAFGRDIEGEPVDPQIFAFAVTNGRRITLSFQPATQADRDALSALLPSGDVTDFSQLIRPIPGYLVRVVPQIKIDDNVVMSGASVSLGHEIDFVFTPKFVSSGPKTFSYRLPAGSYLAVASLAGSVSDSRLSQQRAELSRVGNAVEIPGNPDAAQLTRDDLLGDPYYAGLLAYYGQYQANALMLARNGGGHFALGAGVGTFGYEPEVDYFFGVPRSIKAGSSVFNVPMVNIVGSSTGDSSVSRSLTLQIGIMSSALEHAIPEQMDPNTRAISAARAFEIAVSQGRRIVGADQSNLASALAQVSLAPEAAQEVSAAVAAGRLAILHTGTVSVPGWTGSGYLLIDPSTGAGAYKISGGMNGGFQQASDAITIAAAGASGFLEGRTANYVGRDFWYSERMKYLARVGNATQALGYVGFALNAMTIWSDDTLSTSEKILRVCTEMLFFGITNYLTGAVAAAIAAPIGTVAIPLVVGVAIAAAVSVAMAAALLTIKLMYFTALRFRGDLRWV
ncbi:MAG TPA: transglutaminase-like domain-containing protein [Povalibacter sp.]|uniref:transglutaminase-like domain-containing protein n=1 Tax=Povalibacter sp. TaxID=1962978 RepID=UPI002C7E9215|nr:transglutaminase-like domain-containing protein [Povalibacter sp.]HMN43126.1 transglutaminase-like domain-containing protein [Povalibacter sp.]